MSLKFSLLILLLFSIQTVGHSQNFNKDRIPRYYSAQAGLGPSFIYADNGGGVRRINFKVNPSASVSFSRKINSFLDLRSSLGYQRVASQDQDYYSPRVVEFWRQQEQAVTFQGNVFHLDLAPVIYLFPFENHIDRRDFNLYGSAGIGVLSISKQESRLLGNGIDEQKKSESAFYLPFRAGISYRIGPHSDIALEGTILWTFSDSLDGNVGFNRFNDHLFQGQVVYKRFLGPRAFSTR